METNPSGPVTGQTPAQLPRLYQFIRRTRLPLGLAMFAFAVVGLLLSGGLAFRAPGDISLWDVVILGVIFLSVLLIGTGIIELRHWNGILRAPVRVEALVTNVEMFESGWRRNGTRLPPTYEVHYQYRDTSGVTCTCVSYRLPEEEGALWRELDLADVAYDRHHPGRSLLVSPTPLRRSTPEERLGHGPLVHGPRVRTKSSSGPKERA